MKRALGLRLRWSWRDLRSRWVLVAALAFIIALGTGAFAGLGGTSDWRIRSNDASYAALRMHDLKVTLPEGAFVPAGRLAAVVRAIPDASAVSVAEERLIVSTQVDASTASRTVLVPGEIVGMPPATAPVDSIQVAAGRGLRRSDAGAATAVLESKFATDHHLPATGQSCSPEASLSRTWAPATPRNTSAWWAAPVSCSGRAVSWWSSCHYRARR